MVDDHTPLGLIFAIVLCVGRRHWGFHMVYCALTHLCCHLAVVNPTQGGKVGGLCAVEAVVETSVIAIRKGDHKLAFFLSDLEIARVRRLNAPL